MAKDQFNPTLPVDQGFKLSEFLPTGKAWDAKIDGTTNLGKLLLAFGSEFNRIEALIELTNKELPKTFAEYCCQIRTNDNLYGEGTKWYSSRNSVTK